MVVYIYYSTAAANSISSQLGSSCQGNRYGTEKTDGTARLSHKKSLSSSQPSRPPCWASPLAFGLITMKKTNAAIIILVLFPSLFQTQYLLLLARFKLAFSFVLFHSSARLQFCIPL
jgi:hypothetical protein